MPRSTYINVRLFQVNRNPKFGDFFATTRSRHPRNQLFLVSPLDFDVISPTGYRSQDTGQYTGRHTNSLSEDAVNLRTRLSTLAAITTLALLSACSGESATVGGGANDPADRSNAASGDTINLGAVIPLTGASATIGEDQRRGIELAVEKINADGGVLGKKINVIIEDSGGTAASALDAARKLTSANKVPVVLGEYSSGVTIPLGQFLQQQGLVHMNIGSSSPDIAKIGSYSFSTIGLDTIASKFTAEYLYRNGHRTAALIAPNNAYGSGVADTFKAAFESLGGKLTNTVLYTEGQTDYRAELQRLRGGSPDVIVYSAYGQESKVITSQAYELGLSKAAPWFAIYLSMCTADADPKAVEGQLGMDVNYIGPDGQSYEDAYKAKYNQPFATTFSGYAYDAVMMAAAAIEKAQSTEPQEIAAALKEIGKRYPGVTGQIEFDADNQRADQPYAVLKYTGGKLEPAN